MNRRFVSIICITLVVAAILAGAPVATLAAPAIDDGRQPDSYPAAAPTAAPNLPSTSSAIEAPLDVIHIEDVIVTGSLCVGIDCIADGTESFGYTTVKLKENNLQILFDDTSATAGFSMNDWQITANDSSSGGASYFAIDDITGAKRPFQVMAGAPSGSVYVSSNGKLGLKTTSPILDIHMKSNNTPAIRLEQDNTAGFPAQTWDVAGNETNFFIRDVAGGSRLPFRIRPGAPTSSLDISNSGNVGIGTASPSEKLHVAGNILTEGYIKELSDENAKTAFVPVSSAEVLSVVANLPLSTWSYKDEAGVRHMGPVAQDFYQAFGLGSDDRHIAALDVNGVALASIQALNAQVKEKDASIQTLQGQVNSLEARLNALETSKGTEGVGLWGLLALALLGLAARYYFTQRQV